MEHLSNACQRLQAHDESLTLLNLSCRSIGSEGVVKLSRSCQSNKSNKEDCIEDEASTRNDDTVVTSLPNSPLVALWLEGNDIYPYGARALRTLLEVSPKLKYLYLSNNYIGNAGISALAPIAFSQCKILHIADNKINGPIGGTSISEALQQPECVVETLVLDNNRLKDDGMELIAKALQYNTSLKQLDVRYNKIGRKGLIAIRDVLKRQENTTLEYFIFEEEDNHEEEQQRNHEEITHPTVPVCTRRTPTRRNRKMPRLMEKMTCHCTDCQLRHEIDYLLALNRAGRKEFGDLSIQCNLWPRIMSKVSQDDPSLLFTMLEVRPDVPLRR